MTRVADAASEKPAGSNAQPGRKNGQSFAQEMTHALEKDLAWVNRAIGTLEDPSRDDPSGTGLPQGSRAALEETGAYTAMLAKLHRRARTLAQALRRLQTGTYGVCLSCRERIPPDQLRDTPERTICLRCARERRRDIERVAAPPASPMEPA
jgi:DnaK suppressor protein